MDRDTFKHLGPQKSAVSMEETSDSDDAPINRKRKK
jgi:hypothetical protein